MTDTHEVISAFLDDEPFDAQELAAALSEPSGRALLIDLVALRHIVQPDALPAATLPSRPRLSAVRTLMAAAALVVALVGGYLLGERRSSAVTSQAPAPTRVVQAPSAWEDAPVGGGR